MVYPSFEQDLKEVAEKDKSQVAEQIARQKQAAQEKFKQEETMANQQATQARQQQSVQTQKQRKGFAEYLANIGGTRSGAAAEGEIRMQGGLQQRLGDIGTQERNIYDDINQRRSATMLGLEGELADAISTIESNFLRSIMENKAIQYQNEQKALASGGTFGSTTSGGTSGGTPYNPLGGTDGNVGGSPSYTEKYDMTSIVNLGRGPLSKNNLQDLMSSNQVVAEIVNNKITFRNANEEAKTQSKTPSIVNQVGLKAPKTVRQSDLGSFIRRDSGSTSGAEMLRNQEDRNMR